MLLANKSRLKEKDVQVIETHANLVSMPEFIVYVFNFLTGIGILKMERSYRSGIIPNIVISAIFMMSSFYSFFLFFRCACFFHRDTIEGLWKAIFGEKVGIISIIILILFCQMAVSNYFRIISDTIKGCIEYLFPVSPNFTKDHYFILLLVLVMYSLPISATKSLKFYILLSFLEFCFLILLLCYLIYSFASRVSEFGFDPNHELSIATFDNKIIENMSIFMTSFMIMPLSYPSLGNLSYPTQRRIMNSIFISIFLTFIFYNLFGIFRYLTFFNELKGTVSLCKYESVNFVGRIFLAIVILSTTPCYLNPLRFIFIKIFARNESMHVEIWTTTGIIIFMLGVLFSGFSEPFSTIVSLVKDISGILITYFLIPLMYLKAFRKSRKIHIFGSCFLMLVGVASIVFSIIENFFRKVVE